MSELSCPKCEGKEVTKRGVRLTERREKIQKYFCKTCKHRFVLDTPFFRMRNKEQLITQCTDMYYSGMSFRKIADHLVRFFPKGVHYSTIYRWIMKYVPIMQNFTEKQSIKAGWQLQGDEVEFDRRTNKNSSGISHEFFIDIIDTESRYIVSSDYSKNRDTKALNKVYGKAKQKVGNQVKVISTDGLVGYPRVIKKTFGLNPHATKNPKIIHQIIRSNSGGFNYKVERLHNTLRERTKVMRGFHGCITSAQTLLKGFEIYYNWVRNHQALEGQTPSQKAVPNVELTNKNGWLELIERGYYG
ncbi:DDE-type integrase/transposase/recombinase [Candidatus Dojkabacteria bacterium]|jgi:transposase-like protein|nr:DDE-type integrase/transposase/recombinase [Candidatus Dojkabacteria bacterium]